VSLEFVDTNVLLYAYDVTAGERHERARELVGRLGRTRSGALSVQVLQEFYVNAVHKIAERVAVLGLWAVHTPGPSDVVAAIDIVQSDKVSFWDAMIIRSAGALGCTVLWSEDLNPGQVISGVRVADLFG